jgi:DNA-binding IclR family transcriptional regulator
MQHIVKRPGEKSVLVPPAGFTVDASRQVPPRSTARTALKILELFSPEEPELGVSEMGRRLGVHKSTVSRLVATLEAESFLARTQKGRYRLGLHLWTIGSLAGHSHALYQAALSELCEVRQETGESTHLAVLMGVEVVHLERLHSNRLMKRIAGSLRRLPPHATSPGKVLLANSPDDICERVIALGLRRYTPRTLIDADELRSQLAAIRAQGFAMDQEEFIKGTSSVAVPIFTRDRQSVAAISVLAPSERLAGSRLETVLRVLRRAAGRIELRAP